MHNMDYEPNSEQLQIVTYNGEDTLGYLPTGFDKTLCFVVFDMILQKTHITLMTFRRKS